MISIHVCINMAEIEVKKISSFFPSVNRESKVAVFLNLNLYPNKLCVSSYLALSDFLEYSHMFQPYPIEKNMFSITMLDIDLKWVIGINILNILRSIFLLFFSICFAFNFN